MDVDLSYRNERRVPLRAGRRVQLDACWLYQAVEARFRPHRVTARALADELLDPARGGGAAAPRV
jgi:hypothetical protein